MAGRHPGGRTCNGMMADTVRPVSVFASTLYLFSVVFAGLARHGNAGGGFTRQGTRGANAGGHRGGCL